jgi:lipopolysaccharide export system protein LptA
MTFPQRHLAIAMVIASFVPAVALGERADREKPMDISSKNGLYEGTKETNVKKLEGDVQIERGTMRITAERAIVKETVDGMFAELFGKSAGPITFRQKREGENDFVEASADRAEYDDNTGTIKLYSKVRFKSGGDLMESEYMVYNTYTEKMELRNQIPGAKSTTGSDEGRVVFKVQPRMQTGILPIDGKAPPASKK